CARSANSVLVSIRFLGCHGIVPRPYTGAPRVNHVLNLSVNYVLNLHRLWQHFTGPGGVENGIAQIAPTEISSLIGVWYDVDTHTGIPFFMGSSGSAAVPAGYDELYPGTMDGFKWYDNSGEFRVEVNPDRSVPEGGSFTAFYPAAGALMGGSVVRKLRKP
ncbi:MAG TPA: hypothetical protein VG796_22705, partial [Verrucomicrobiales bacterium]|nr:hypothetical protein [Verrucomicrobiales bacterium]